MRQRLEYALAWLIIKFIGALPRPLARAAGIILAWKVYILHVRLRRVGMRNLALAFPEKSHRERARILRGVFTSFGRQLAEVCLFPKYTRENVGKVVVYWTTSTSIA
jgi:KDO2-lipid IV(A) lauroyltransferase